MNSRIKLKDIVYPRLSPYVWDFLGYGGGFIVIFYYNKIWVLIYYSLFILYGILNIFFDLFTVSFDYSNNNMPNYKEIGDYNFYITNKKYLLQNTDISLPFEKINMIDNSKLKIELSIYVGENYYIKHSLLVIYLLGITKRNYTIIDYNNLKDTIIHYL